MTRRVPLAVALALVASAGLAQDEKPPEEGLPRGEREVTEEMLRICPDLKTAVGRRRDQLLALYFDLDADKAGTPETQKKVKDLFDLGNAADAALLDETFEAKGPYRAQSGVRCVVAASGPRGLVFALERFEKLKPQARGRVMDSLAAIPHKEAWRFLVKCLGDKTPVPDWRARMEAPPGYKDLRVCDWALRTLGAKCIGVEGVSLPEELRNGKVSSTMAVEERDGRVAQLKEWLAKDEGWKKLLAAAPRATDALAEAEKKKAEELLGRLGVETD